MLSTGDLVRVTVKAGAANDATAVLDRLARDEELSAQLAPIPSRSSSTADFGGITLAQEFIVTVGAELTATAVIAAVRALFARSDAEKAETEPEAQAPPVPGSSDIDVTATMTADGVCEVTVTVSSRS